MHQDALHALSCLRPGGWLVFHDFLSRNWKEQHVPRLQRSWTGDCWKVALELLASSEELDFCMLKADHGVGIAYPKVAKPKLKDLKLEGATFDDFAKALPALPLVDWEGLMRFMQERKKIMPGKSIVQEAVGSKCDA